MGETASATGLPENPKLTQMKEKLADALTRGLFPDGARNKELQAQVKKMLDEEIIALEDQKKFELWLMQLSMLDERMCLLQKSAPNDAQVAKILGNEVKDFFNTRDEIFQSILEHLGEESELYTGIEEKKKQVTFTNDKGKPEQRDIRNDAFITIGKKEKESTAGEIKEIEDKIFSYMYYTNKVNKSGKMPLPSFQDIREWRGTIAKARGTIVSRPPEDHAATLARLDRIAAGLSVLENMDPIGQANADPVGCAVRNGGPAMLDAFKRLGLVNQDGTPRYDMRKTGNGPPSRDPLVMGLRGVGLAAGTFMFAASLIVLIRKWKQGQGFGPSDALNPMYGFIALKCAGFNFGGATEKETDIVGQIQSSVAKPEFQAMIQKMGGGTDAAKAAEAFSLLVRDDTEKLTEIKEFLKPIVVLPRLEDLKTFGVKEESMLYKALSKKEVTAQDRRLFLTTLLEHQIEDEDRMHGIMQIIEGPKVK